MLNLVHSSTQERPNPLKNVFDYFGCELHRNTVNTKTFGRKAVLAYVFGRSQQSPMGLGQANLKTSTKSVEDNINLTIPEYNFIAT